MNHACWHVVHDKLIPNSFFLDFGGARQLMSRLLLAGATAVGVAGCQSASNPSSSDYKTVALGAPYKGDFVQSDGKSFPMVLNEGKLPKVSYPSLGCEGHLEQTSRTMNEVTFIERIDSGNCIDGGTVVTHMSGRDVINVSWSKAGAPFSASARLYRNGKKPAETISTAGNSKSGTLSPEQGKVKVASATAMVRNKPEKGSDNFSNQIYTDSFVVKTHVRGVAPGSKTFENQNGLMGILTNERYSVQVSYIHVDVEIELDPSGAFARDILKFKLDITGKYKACANTTWRHSIHTNNNEIKESCFSIMVAGKEWPVDGKPFVLNAANGYKFKASEIISIPLIMAASDGNRRTITNLDDAEGKVYDLEINGKDAWKIVRKKYK